MGLSCGCVNISSGGHQGYLSFPPPSATLPALGDQVALKMQQE